MLGEEVYSYYLNKIKLNRKIIKKGKDKNEKIFQKKINLFYN